MIIYALGFINNPKLYNGLCCGDDDLQALDFYDKTLKDFLIKEKDAEKIGIFRLGSIDEKTGLIVPERTLIRRLIFKEGSK